MNKNQLIGLSIAIEFPLRIHGSTARKYAVLIEEQGGSTGDSVSTCWQVVGSKVDMSQGIAVGLDQRHAFERLYLQNASRRTKMVRDAVTATEALGGDDFFIVDAFVLVSGRTQGKLVSCFMDRVAFLRDGTKVTILWHFA